MQRGNRSLQLRCQDATDSSNKSKCDTKIKAEPVDDDMVMVEDCKPVIEPVVSLYKSEDSTSPLENNIDNSHEPKDEVEYDNEPIVAFDYCDDHRLQDPLAEESMHIKDEKPEFEMEELIIDDQQIKRDAESNQERWSLAQTIWIKQMECADEEAIEREPGTSVPANHQPVAKVVDGRKTFCCPHCGYEAGVISAMKNHIRSHTGEKPFKCAICSKRFSRSDSLNSHMTFVHDGYRPHKCFLCSFSSGKANNLKTHMLIHTGDKPHKCTLCSYRSYKSSDLKRHMLVHTGDKPHKCSLCSYRSTGAGNLKKHMSVHTGYKPHKCSMCSYSSNTGGELKRHTATHTGYKPFRCTLCSYRCSQSSHLKVHMRVHSGSKTHYGTD